MKVRGEKAGEAQALTNQTCCILVPGITLSGNVKTVWQ